MTPNSYAKKILSVEDNPTDLKFIKSTLEKHGYIVLSARTGEDGLAIVLHEKIDLIILDELLPDTRGTEVCRKLRADPRTKDIPVLFLTVVDEPQNVLDHFELDALSHLTKPISGSELVHQVESILHN